MRRVIVTMMAVVALCLPMMAGCQGREERAPERMVDALLQKIFSAPDADLAQLVENAVTVIGIDVEPDRAAELAAQAALLDELRSRYSPYFTEQGLEDFIISETLNRYLYQLVFAKEPATIAVRGSELEQLAGKGNYRFEAAVSMAGKDAEAVISGYAYLDDNHMLTKFFFSDDKDLLELLPDLTAPQSKTD